MLLTGCFPSGESDQGGAAADNAAGGSDSGSDSQAATSAAVDGTDDTTDNAAADTSETTDFVLGDLVEAFDRPPLDKLVADNQWRDMPVLDSVQLMRDRKAGEDPPPTVADVLGLRNTSPAINDKILAAMGQLADEKTAVDDQAEWRRHTSGDVKSTNPLLGSSVAEFDVSSLTGFGLFGFDWNFVPFASKDSVASWKSSENGLYDLVEMRQDLVWSDGTPITAHDIEFSFRVIMSSKVPVPAMRSGTDQLKAVVAYDDHTIVFFHQESLATNVWNINFGVIPKHVYASTIADDPTLAASEAHVSRDENPVVGGAYIMTKRERGQEIILERRESYYMFNGKQVRDKPYFETVRFRILQDPSTSLLALKRGDIEELQLTPEQWKSQTGDDEFYELNTKVYDLEWVYFYFGWNNRSPFFRDKRVRQAMSLAFDHKEMLEQHRFGMDEASTGVFHSTSRWAPPNPPAPYQQDLDKAEELLAAAGWEDSDGDGYLDNEVELDPDFDGNIDGKARIKFEFTILTSNRQDRIEICNLLRENLDSIGISCQVKPVEFTTLQQLSRDHKFHAMFAGWGTGADPDTSENLWTTKAIDAGRNYVCYSSTEIDALFEQGKRELDPEKRAKVYQQIHLKLWDDQPYTWLYFRNGYFGFNKSLRGYNFSPRGPYGYGPGQSTIFKAPAAQ
ncbi:MAG TPA: peptide ABC transporter substrate-binding protein [Planctomycetaceae bacterium]|nr:peptide ABC transporter substrate-binding protein [Planctomycetaceae bacterium]